MAVTGTFYVAYNGILRPSIMRSARERPAGAFDWTGVRPGYAPRRAFHLAFSFHLRCRPDEIDHPFLA